MQNENFPHIYVLLNIFQKVLNMSNGALYYCLWLATKLDMFSKTIEKSKFDFPQAEVIQTVNLINH